MSKILPGGVSLHLPHVHYCTCVNNSLAHHSKGAHIYLTHHVTGVRFYLAQAHHVIDLNIYLAENRNLVTFKVGANFAVLFQCMMPCGEKIKTFSLHIQITSSIRAATRSLNNSIARDIIAAGRKLTVEFFTCRFAITAIARQSFPWIYGTSLKRLVDTITPTSKKKKLPMVS